MVGILLTYLDYFYLLFLDGYIICGLVFYWSSFKQTVYRNLWVSFHPHSPSFLGSGSTCIRMASVHMASLPSINHPFHFPYLTSVPAVSLRLHIQGLFCKHKFESFLFCSEVDTNVENQ